MLKPSVISEILSNKAYAGSANYAMNVPFFLLSGPLFIACLFDCLLRVSERISFSLPTILFFFF